MELGLLVVKRGKRRGEWKGGGEGLVVKGVVGIAPSDINKLLIPFHNSYSFLRFFSSSFFVFIKILLYLLLRTRFSKSFKGEK